MSMDRDIIFKITSNLIIFYAHLLLFSERQVSHIGGQNSRQVGQSKNRLLDDDDQCPSGILNLKVTFS
jgi:hypothetical protein